MNPSNKGDKRPQPYPELIWHLERDNIEWSGTLTHLGPSYGWEAAILRDGQPFLSHRFALKAQARDWVEARSIDVVRRWKR